MKSYRWPIIIAVIVLGGLAAWYFRSGGESVRIDLVQEFPNAKGKQPTPDVFSVVDAKLAGESRRAISVNTASRITWHETVPDNAMLKVSLGLKEEAWTVQGDGVFFQIGVSDGKTYEALLNLTVDPFANQSDRRWQDLTIDLSQYAGESVDLIFNTRASPAPPPGQPGRNDTAGDMALWGAPRVVVR